MLQAGFARLDVTPPLGSPVDGYFKDRVGAGILDPIELNAIALSDGAHRAVMIAGDFLGIDGFHVAQIKAQIKARTGLESGEIFISATHSHTSVFLRQNPASNLPQEYINILYRKFGDVAQLALADLADATLYTAHWLRAPLPSLGRAGRHQPGQQAAAADHRAL